MTAIVGGQCNDGCPILVPVRLKVRAKNAVAHAIHYLEREHQNYRCALVVMMAGVHLTF